MQSEKNINKYVVSLAPNAKQRRKQKDSVKLSNTKEQKKQKHRNTSMCNDKHKWPLFSHKDAEPAV